MGVWDKIRAALRREKRDLDEAVDEFEVSANAALDRREHELHATPEEKLAIEQERGAEVDADLEAVKRRIEGDAPGK